MRPKHLTLARAEVTAKIGHILSNNTVPISVTTTAPALYVTLTSQAQGRFSENCFMMPFSGRTKTIYFLPFRSAGSFGTEELRLLTTNLRIEHLSMYLSDASRTAV